MRKQKWALGLAAGALLAWASFQVWLYFYDGHPISRATYQRLRPGMTRDEVRAAVGLPPDDYYTGPRGTWTSPRLVDTQLRV